MGSLTVFSNRRTMTKMLLNLLIIISSQEVHLILLWVVIISELKRKVKRLKGRRTDAQSKIIRSKSQEAVKVKYTYNFSSLDIFNTDSNLYCKYSEQEYFSKLNIEKDYFEYEQKSKKYWKDTLEANDTVLKS